MVSNGNGDSTELKTIHVRQMREVTRENVANWETQCPALKKLNDATLEKPRGFILPRGEAWNLCGGTEEFEKVADKWKRCLLFLRGITVEWDHKAKGYRFNTTQYHLRERHQKVLARQERTHRKESLRLAVMRDDDLETDYEKRLRVMLMHQHNDDAGKIEAQREHARLAVTKPETMPRIQ